MNKSKFSFNLLWLLPLMVSLSCCGGSGGGSSSGGTAVPTVSGVAATGAAISERISLVDAASHELYHDTSDGSYSFNVSGLTPPYLLKAQWTDGGVSKQLYSFASAVGVANINPLSNLALASAAGVSDPSPIYAAPSVAAFQTISTNLPGAITTLETKLKPLLDKYPQAGISPISGAFSADHTGLDQLFDENTIQISEGVVTIQNKTTGALAFNALVRNIDQGVMPLMWTNQEALVAQDPQVAVDPNGNAFVIWTQSVGGVGIIQAKRYATDTGWSEVTAVGSTGYAGFPQIGADASGNAIAVWTQYTGGMDSIWANRYTVGTGWGTPTRIGNIINEASYPKLSVDAECNAAAAWYQWDGSPGGAGFTVWASCYTAGTGWGTPTMIGNSGPNSFRPDVAIDPQGNAVAVWVEGTQFLQDIWASRYTPQAGWSAPTAIGNHAGVVYAQAQVAVDPFGNAIAVWGQDSSGYKMWANRYTVGSGWGTAVKIGGNLDSYHPGIGMDSNGNAIAIWQDTDGMQYNLWSNSYTVGSGWGAPVQVGSTGGAHDAVIGVDANGGAIALWYQDTGGLTIWMNRYVVGAGWSAASLVATIEGAGALDYPTPALGVNPTGYSVLVWGLDSM